MDITFYSLKTSLPSENGKYWCKNKEGEKKVCYYDRHRNIFTDVEAKDIFEADSWTFLM